MKMREWDREREREREREGDVENISTENEDHLCIWEWYETILFRFHDLNFKFCFFVPFLDFMVMTFLSFEYHSLLLTFLNVH